MPLDPRAIIADGENAKIGFKRDDRNLLPEHLAREIVAFANMNGGMIVVGVEDDGAVSGVTRNNLQAWLMDTVIGRFIDPQIVPDYDEFVLKRQADRDRHRARGQRKAVCGTATRADRLLHPPRRYGTARGPRADGAAISIGADWCPWRRCRCRGVRWPTSTCAGWRTTS